MLMLSRAIHTYRENSALEEPVVFDRGVPDMVAYARLFELDETPYGNAAQEFRYTQEKASSIHSTKPLVQY